MARFMLILNDTSKLHQGRSPEEMQRIFEKYRAWTDRLRAADRLLSSDKLKEEGGKVLSVEKGRLSVVDGPYSEAREVVGGYMMIRAASYDEAVEIASDCPHLNYGTIAIRQTDAMGCGGD
jgi:hypothetical protein